MAAKKTNQRSTEESLMDIINTMKKIDYIDPEIIPDIELYMDQVTTFMDAHLGASRRSDEEKVLTKTMINNYTKNDVLPPPVKKKYSKEHMCLLILLYYFKNVLSIDDIQKIFHPLKEMFYDEKDPSIGVDEIYAQIFTMEKKMTDKLTKDVLRRFQASQELFPDVEDERESDYLSRFAFICLLSFDAYLKKQMVERLIDETLSDI
ncbi:MAG TPA: hypothetical protein DCP06_01740 [Lachnospiraceae bacterium]|nr:hypothetical protein [Lachnospiraceae bacterium]